MVGGWEKCSITPHVTRVPVVGGIRGCHQGYGRAGQYGGHNHKRQPDALVVRVICVRVVIYTTDVTVANRH